MEKPDVAYEMMEELYLDESNPFLILQAYMLTGHNDRIKHIVGDGIPYEVVINFIPTQEGMHSLCDISSLPPPPECEEGCFPFLVFESNDPEEPICFWICECPPPPPPPTRLNNCGCVVPNNPRIPAGCVEVEDDALNPDGVQIVRIEVWDGFWIFKQQDFTYTDMQGCWQIEREYDEMDMKVKFENENMKVRDTRYWFGFKVLDGGTRSFDNPPLNDDYILYNAVTDRRNWAASHTHNTDIQYRITADNDNFTQPRLRINYSLTPIDHAGTGAAPMLQNVPFAQANVYLGTMTITAIPNSLGLLPDIVLQYPAGVTARELINVGIHELAHASHYVTVGEDFWGDVRYHVLLNGGDGEFPDFTTWSSPQQNALAEAVAEYVEESYGPIGTGDRFRPWRSNYIPRGMLKDLDDPVDFSENISTIPGVIPPQMTVDNVEGFTIEMFYTVLNPNVTTIREFRDELGNQFLAATPNTLANFNNFIDVHDVFN